jgi:hypothetical protein
MDNQNSSVREGSTHSKLENFIEELFQNLIIRKWKQYLISLILGMVFGYGYWLYFSNYSVSYYLNNNSSVSYNNEYPKSDLNKIESASINLATWKSLQNELPNIISKVVKLDKELEKNGEIYDHLTSKLWWQNNTSAVYNIVKNDTKQFVNISKEIDAALNKISAFKFTFESSNINTAESGAYLSASFFCTAGAYIQTKMLLENNSLIVTSESAELMQKITEKNIQMLEKVRTLKHLKELQKIYPIGTNVNVVISGDIKAESKYLPLSTQIIAISTDIHSDNESLNRMKDRLLQLDFLKKFIEQSSSLIKSELNGFLLIEKLLMIENKLRTQYKNNDMNKIYVLDQINASLTDIKVRFNQNIEERSNITIEKKGMTKSIVKFSLLTISLTLLFFISQYFLKNRKLDY